MRSLLDQAQRTIVPGRDARYGILPPLLVGMTVVTGLVDAFSYLTLGHVFVANMTGNIVFLGFALAGVGGFSIAASLAALGAFLLGALLGGALGARDGAHPERLLSVGAGLQIPCLLVCVVLSAVSPSPQPASYRYALIAVLGAAMGLQNAVVRKLSVPDLTTTVLTMTITGMAADLRMAGGSGSQAGRRLVAVAAMLLGALVGAILILRFRSTYALVIAVVLIAVVAVAARPARSPAQPRSAEAGG